MQFKINFHFYVKTRQNAIENFSFKLYIYTKISIIPKVWNLTTNNKSVHSKFSPKKKKGQIGQSIHINEGRDTSRMQAMLDDPLAVSMNKFQINFRTISALYEARRKPSLQSQRFLRIGTLYITEGSL